MSCHACTVQVLSRQGAVAVRPLTRTGWSQQVRSHGLLSCVNEAAYHCKRNTIGGNWNEHTTRSSKEDCDHWLRVQVDCTCCSFPADAGDLAGSCCQMSSCTSLRKAATGLEDASGSLCKEAPEGASLVAKSFTPKGVNPNRWTSPFGKAWQRNHKPGKS